MGAKSHDEDDERIAFLENQLEKRLSNDSEPESKPLDRRRKRGLAAKLALGLATCSGCRTRRSGRRHPLQLLRSCVRYALLFTLAVFVTVPVLFPSYTRPPQHYRDLAARCQDAEAKAGCANVNQEKVFISVSLYDKDGHLAGGLWGERMLQLIELLGPENTFLSIYENDTPGGGPALEEFKSRVKCRNEIVNEAHMSLDGFPNITLPDGHEYMKRLTYLSEVRNKSLRPLDKSDAARDMPIFDKVLFLNDIAFNPIDAAQLLFSTNVGENGRAEYLSACALDYRNPVLLYDMFAQRDAEGFSDGIPIFPLFTNAGQGLSRHDMMAQKDAVRMKACWGGMVAMQARYVQSTATLMPTEDFEKPGAHVIKPEQPSEVMAPVRFRYEPDVFYDACECCLLLADVTEAARKELGDKTPETFVNPYVRVAYDEFTLKWQRLAQRWERIYSPFHTIISALAGLPRNNPHREVQQGDKFTEEVWDVKLNSWKMVERIGRSGLFCGVREMQVINYEARTGDKNWHDTFTPPGQTLFFPT